MEASGAWLKGGLRFAAEPVRALMRTRRRNMPRTQEVAQL